MSQKIIHLLRHGEVYNPKNVIYGHMPGFHLSKKGLEMVKIAYIEFLQFRNIKHIICSPLERTQETAKPIAKALKLNINIDNRITEARNYLEGLNIKKEILFKPNYWKYLVNPFSPSWGESYKEIYIRMQQAIQDSLLKTEDNEVLMVSHQLPIWVCRLYAEGKNNAWQSFQKRECSLSSITSFFYINKILEKIEYREIKNNCLRKEDVFKKSQKYE